MPVEIQDYTAKSLADRIDLGEICLPPTQADLDKIKSIRAKQINMPTPNMIRHVYKVRRGKLSKIRIWQYADLGTCRTTDLFVTDNDYKLIPVTATKVERIDKIIEENSVPLNTIEDITEEEHLAPLFNW